MVLLLIANATPCISSFTSSNIVIPSTEDIMFSGFLFSDFSVAKLILTVTKDHTIFSGTIIKAKSNAIVIFFTKMDISKY